MHEQLHRYINYPQYVQDNPHSFSLALLHSPQGEQGVLEQFNKIAAEMLAMRELIVTPLAASVFDDVGLSATDSDVEQPRTVLNSYHRRQFAGSPDAASDRHLLSKLPQH